MLLLFANIKKSVASFNSFMRLHFSITAAYFSNANPDDIKYLEGKVQLKSESIFFKHTHTLRANR